MRRILAIRFKSICGMDSNERVHNERIVHGTTAVDQDLNSLFVRKLRSVGPIGRQGVEAVDYGEDSCADRNVSSSKPLWISRAVPVLVVVPNNWHDGIRKINCGKNIRSDTRVQLHF